MVAVLSVVALSPQRASAHLVTTGAGPFYDGVAHFFLSYEDLLLVVALALLAGLLGKPTARGLVLVLPITWLIGMMFGAVLVEPLPASEWILAVTLMVSGVGLAIRPEMPPVVFQALAILGGLIHGFFNGAALQGTDTSVIAGAGIVVSAWGIAVLLSAIAVSVHHAWQHMALRVIGSWISAIGLLALAWCMRN